MCEPADAIRVLRDIPFRVLSLEKALAQGSCERALLRCVYDSVRQDIEYAVRQIEAERKQDSMLKEREKNDAA
jgi:hypothetical protein